MTNKFDQAVRLLSETEFSQEDLKTLAFVLEKKIIFNERYKVLEELLKQLNTKTN